MESQKIQEDSFSNVKILRPKALRRYKKTKKVLKSSISSTSSKKSSEIKIFDGEETNIELDNISIDEINNDFFLYSEKNEEEECFNELCDIINAPKNVKEKKDSNKIKRCKNPIQTELKMLEESHFDELIQGFEALYKNQNQNSSGDEEEK